MKWLLIVLVSGLAVFGITRKNSFDSKKKSTTSQSFALLELFTSEGCSSCPPADRLLPQLATANPNVVPLSFHVDYWDGLGWRDPFSNVEFTDRQKDYARRFRLESIYTPQLIINGEYELVGSNRSAAKSDIDQVLKQKASVEIKIDDVKKEKNKLLVTCSLAGSLQETVFMAALVQKHAEMNVKGGENGGAKLSHTNVVRSFVHEAAKDKMQFEINVPRDLSDDNMEIVVYTQAKDLRVTGVDVWKGRE